MLFPYFVYIAHFTKFTCESFLLNEKSLLVESHKQKKVVSEKKFKKLKNKTGSKKKGRVPICQEKKKLPLWKRLVLAELHADVQILNKEVVVKPKLTIHNAKN